MRFARCTLPFARCCHHPPLAAFTFGRTEIVATSMSTLTHSVNRITAVPYRIAPALSSGLMRTLTDLPESAVPGSLRLRRERAERIMNGLRAAVLLLLGISALVYAPALSPDRG